MYYYYTHTKGTSSYSVPRPSQRDWCSFTTTMPLQQNQSNDKKISNTHHLTIEQIKDNPDFKNIDEKEAGNILTTIQTLAKLIYHHFNHRKLYE